MATVPITTTEKDQARRAALAMPPRQFAWWMWPHLWSLDAPVVAVTWQCWWAHCAGVGLSWRHGLVLGAAVWMIYLADRLADVSAATARARHGTARHVFYRRVRTATACGVLALGVLLAGFTPVWLSKAEFRAGLGLLTLAGSYFWLTHRRRDRNWTATVPKEAAVGGLFAVGTVLFVGCRAGEIAAVTWSSWLSSAVLFFLNCGLISRWESSPQDQCDPASLINAFPRTVRYLGDGCLALGASAASLSLATGTRLFLPVAVSAILLWLLDRCRARLSADALRVLVDAALLTPWCFLPGPF